MNEMDMALIIAATEWRGTSLVDGGFAVLEEIYSAHRFCGRKGKCTRCGRKDTDSIHEEPQS